MRLPIAVIALCCPLVVGATPFDLDAPGAMSALERNKPSHHARVMKLVSAAQRVPCQGEAFKRVQVAAAASDLDCSMLIKTSLPPKQRVTFALDGTVYTTVVVLRY